jgi:hypothetical protein
MKKAIIVLMALVVCSVSVFAGFREVRCDEGWFNSDMCRDFELQDEFDETHDRIVEVEQESVSRDFRIGTYIIDNQDSWSTDNSGTSFSRVLAYLNEDYLSFIMNIFALADDVQNSLDRMEARIMVLEQQAGITHTEVELDCMQAQVQYSRTGETATVNGVTYTPNVGCLKFE